MKTVYLERSTGSVRDGSWVSELDLEGVERIVVGTGPGSFAGIRSAIAFAEGYRLGKPETQVVGVSSACAIEMDVGDFAVVGDARQGKAWLAVFAAGRLTGEVRQTELAAIGAEVPPDLPVVSPDDKRIGEALKGTFGERYRGERMPTESGLRAYAERFPEDLKPEPLPIYLNPAVRN